MKNFSIIAALIFSLTLFNGCELLKGSTGGGASGYKLPFTVKVGGQDAVENMAVCASIANPVANNAPLELGLELSDSEQVIVNVFASDDKAAPLEETKNNPTVLIFKTNKGSLDKTVGSSKPLKPGMYVMNVVAKGNTARVFFKVQ